MFMTQPNVERRLVSPKEIKESTPQIDFKLNGISLDSGGKFSHWLFHAILLCLRLPFYGS